MDVVALSPVLASRLVWRRDAERWALTVVVKATFDLLPGEVRLSGQPVPLNAGDVFEGGDPARALIAPSDLSPFKARADVILVGHAYAPHGRPVSTLTARLAVAGMDKSVAVHGNRMVSARGVGPALPFARMALTYERASGGPGTSNPVGMPRGERLPNLEPVAWSSGLWQDKPSGVPSSRAGAEVAPPIGFGPIAPAWPERAAKRHAWRFEEPLPEDLDASFFNAAPADQQVAFLRGDETLVLEHLHPDHAMLATRLAGVVPRAFADRRRGAPEPVEMLADTLWIDTDRRKLAIVWRGETGLSAPDEPGRVLVAMTNAREPLGWEQMLELYRALSTNGSGDSTTFGEDDDSGQGDDDVEDELRSTNAVPAARLPGLSLFDDEDSSEDDLPSRVDPIGTSTRAFAMPGGAVIPDAAPVWLATPSRQGALPPRRATLASPFAPAPAPEPETGPLPQADLVWDGPADSAEPLTLPPPALPPPGSMTRPTTEPPPALEGTRTGPLPVLSSTEPASPWASGLEPGPTGGTIAPLLPLPAPSAVMVKPEPPVEPRPRAPKKAPPRAPSDAVDLLWFEAESVARIASRFRELVDDLDMEPLDPAHDLPVDDPVAARDRHHVFGVLTRAALTDARGVPAAVRAATDAHGRFTPPLVVVEGELAFGLDERSVLKTTAACAKPLAKENKKLQEVLASVDEVMETPLLLGAAGASEGLLREVLAAVSQSKRALPVKVLEEHVERVLLAQRSYQIRTLLGGPQIRAALSPGQGALALISYIPEAVAPKLPLSLRFRARLVAEVHPSPDPQEAAPLALKVVALSRLVPLPGRA